MVSKFKRVNSIKFEATEMFKIVLRRFGSVAVGPAFNEDTDRRQVETGS